MEYINVDERTDLSTFDFKCIMYIGGIQRSPDPSASYGFPIYTVYGGLFFVKCDNPMLKLGMTPAERDGELKKFIDGIRQLFIERTNLDRECHKI